MVPGLELLANKEYLGRMILMGIDASGENDVIAYALTGRSPPSRARKLVREQVKEGEIVRIEVTEPEQLAKGDPALLVYNAMREVNEYYKKGIIVSNGAQTDLVYSTWEKDVNSNSAGILERTFWKPCIVKEKIDGKETGKQTDVASYEPDAPNYTPRITGLLKAGCEPMLAIVRQSPELGIAEFEMFRVRVTPGYGKFVSTYTGQNVPKGAKIPSFLRAPWTMLIDQKNPQELAHDLYDVLGPKTGEQYISPGLDFRVSVAACFRNKATGKTEYCIIPEK